jgi:hypothetical protein
MVPPPPRAASPGPVKLVFSVILLLGGGLWIALDAVFLAVGVARRAETPGHNGSLIWPLLFTGLLLAPGVVAMGAGLEMSRELRGRPRGPVSSDGGSGQASSRRSSRGGAFGYLLLLLGAAWVLLAGGCTANFMTMAGPGLSVLLPVGIGVVCLAPGIVCLWAGWRVVRASRSPG